VQRDDAALARRALKEDEPDKFEEKRVAKKQRVAVARKKQRTEQAVHCLQDWHRRRWADDKPTGTQIVVVQQIFATPQADQSKLLVVEEGQYLYLRGYTADGGWAQCQTNELGIQKQIGFVPTQSLALFSEEEVARWSPVAPVVAATGGGQGAAAAAAPPAGELSKLKKPELQVQLRKRGLLVSGKKEELVARLQAGWESACSF
jgi:hypothetical protein